MDMCQWLGTSPDGESWLRGRALKVETRAVGSGVCCGADEGDVLDMVDAGGLVEVSVFCQRWVYAGSCTDFDVGKLQGLSLSSRSDLWHDFWSIYSCSIN